MFYISDIYIIAPNVLPIYVSVDVTRTNWLRRRNVTMGSIQSTYFVAIMQSELEMKRSAEAAQCFLAKLHSLKA